MEASEQRRKRKRDGVVFGGGSGRHIFHFTAPSSRSLFLCSSFLIFLLFVSSHYSFFLFFINTTTLRPSLTLSLLYSSASHSILDPLTPITFSSSSLPYFTVQNRIVFPDLILLITRNHNPKTPLFKPHELECIYYYHNNGSGSSEPDVDVEVQPVLSTDQYDETQSIARCPFSRTNGTAGYAVDLRWRRGGGNSRSLDFLLNQTAFSWDKVVYEAMLDGDTVVVFVKGLNLRPHKVSDPKHFKCHFGLKGLHRNGSFLLATRAVSVAQEVVRCSLPQSVRNNPDKVRGIGITVSHLIGNFRHPVREILPSVARIGGSGGGSNGVKAKKYELCVCTMVWNQGSALREWIMYHAWLGVERWIIYDNNSDDDIEEVIQDLDSEGYNVRRQSWPWIKTQEAGFSHCALKAREECKWVGFFDVDEFFYFPNEFHHQLGQNVPGEKSLRSAVSNYSSSSMIAEIRTACHSFGPSGLRSHPKQGVTLGYTCRLQSPERHKSIVRPDLLDISLLNVVHHFQLRSGYRYINMPEGSAVINHYKYQVWDTFKAKFFRRVATYVVDWQEDQNKGSKDRAPGLGTEAIEPMNWHLQFCEVWDTGLKDFLLYYVADPATGSLPWERSFL